MAKHIGNKSKSFHNYLSETHHNAVNEALVRCGLRGVSTTTATATDSTTPATTTTTTTTPKKQKRNTSLPVGYIQRAPATSGATWHVQVVRNKMTSTYFWQACRALLLGVILMVIGATMATVGFYAEQLSIGQEISGNSTISVKNESKGFHLNNLSYAGPIIMGFGGFIVVAACVMTFEARDSAAKVVPIRPTPNTSARYHFKSSSCMRHPKTLQAAASQTHKWDQNFDVFKLSPGERSIPDRQAITAELKKFSQALNLPKNRNDEQTHSNNMKNTPTTTISPTNMNRHRRRRYGSVPNLTALSHSYHKTIRLSPYHNIPHPHNKSSIRSKTKRKSRDYRNNATTYLNPSMLKFHRNTVSVDESGPYYANPKMDAEWYAYIQHISNLQQQQKQRIRDRTKRSDTARKHILARQKTIEKDDCRSLKSANSKERRGSSPSDGPCSANQTGINRKTRTSPTHQRTKISDLSKNEKICGNSTQFNTSLLSATPSIEYDFQRSQLSICSAPIHTNKGSLSCQSSLEPSVPEEDTIQLDSNDAVTSSTTSQILNSVLTSVVTTRPDELTLNCSTVNNSNSILNDNNNITRTNGNGIGAEIDSDKINFTEKSDKKNKLLFRSNSACISSSNSSTSISNPYKIKSKFKLDSKEIEKIYSISNFNNNNNFMSQNHPHNSIDVIQERRTKNFKKSASLGVTGSSTSNDRNDDDLNKILNYNEYYGIEEKIDTKIEIENDSEINTTSDTCHVHIDVDDENQQQSKHLVHQMSENEITVQADIEFMV